MRGRRQQLPAVEQSPARVERGLRDSDEKAHIQSNESEIQFIRTIAGSKIEMGEDRFRYTKTYPLKIGGSP